MKKKMAIAVISTAMVMGIALTGCGKSGTLEIDGSNQTKEEVEQAIDEADSDVDPEVKEAVADMISSDTDTVQQDMMEYMNGDYTFSYDPKYFDYYEDETGNSVTVSFYNEDVQMAGSNVIEITEIENADALTVIQEKMDEYGGTQEQLMQNYIGGEDNIGYSYAPELAASEGSGLKISETFYTIPDGDNVVLIEVMRTLGDDEETAILIDDKISEVLDTFKLM